MKRLHTLPRNNEGATIIEFAIVAPVLFLLVFGIIEFSLLMFASSVVEGATSNAARLSKTGAERSTAGTPEERAQADSGRLRELILQRGSGVLKSENLNVVTLPQATSRSGTMGDSGEVVIYQITYNWPISTPLIGNLISQDGIYTISSTTVVVNEPFDEDISNNNF